MGKKLQEPVYPPTFASADAAYNSTINLIADCVNHAENFIKTKDWKKFSDIINRGGYASPIRMPRGRDISAACGQLKSDTKKEKASIRYKKELAKLKSERIRPL